MSSDVFIRRRVPKPAGHNFCSTGHHYARQRILAIHGYCRLLTSFTAGLAPDQRTSLLCRLPNYLHDLELSNLDIGLELKPA